MSHIDPFLDGLLSPTSAKPNEPFDVAGTAEVSKGNNEEAADDVDGDECSSAVFEVGVHVYDLSKGLATRAISPVIGKPCEGIFHSGIVVYGFEYFFEGGICRTPSGKTRFGKETRSVTVGETKMEQVDFENWVRAQERIKYKLRDYNTVKHNCHAFVDEACRLLCGKPAPQFLFDNVEEVLQCVIGKMVCPLSARITGGMQRFISRKAQMRRCRQLLALKRSEIAMKQCGVVTSPPKGVFTFHVGDRGLAAAAVRRLAQCQQRKGVKEGSAAAACPEEGGNGDGYQPLLNATQLACIERIAKLISIGSFGDEFDVVIMVRIITALLPRTVLSEEEKAYAAPSLALVLDAWRVLTMNSNFVAVAAYDQQLDDAILRLAFCFHVMPVVSQIAFLRLLSNYFAFPEGAAAVVDFRRLPKLKKMIADGLSSPHDGVAAVAAALVNNICHATVLLTKGDVEFTLSVKHPIRGIVTLISIHMQEPHVSEAVRLRLLMGLHRLVQQGGELAAMLNCGYVAVDMPTLFGRCQIIETKALVLLISALMDSSLMPAEE